LKKIDLNHSNIPPEKLMSLDHPSQSKIAPLDKPHPKFNLSIAEFIKKTKELNDYLD
jgi:hypothetical protein